MADGKNLLGLEIDGAELRQFVKTLEQFEPGLRRQFVRDIKREIKPLADTIATRINGIPFGTEGFMRGWRHNGEKAWSKVRAVVYATPGGGKSISVARIEVFGTGEKKAALKIADLAGTRSTTQLSNQLDDIAPLWRGKGGRLVWTNFIGQRKKMIDIIGVVLNRFATRVNAGGKP